MNLALILLPSVLGLACFLITSDRLRRTVLVTTAAVHAALTAWIGAGPDFGGPRGWIYPDAPGYLFLAITSGLFLFTSFYAVGYLQREEKSARRDFEEGFLFRNSPEQVFTGSLLLFLASMSLVALSQHMGILWVAIEATTLTSAPLIYFHRHHRSLEAMWKYLLVCSVGIALALLGTFFLSASAGRAAGENALYLPRLLPIAGGLDPFWLKMAFIFLLAGYGTKMGLAPLHTWLPDAHSEAPSVISALLSGALLNCAFLGVLRAHQICASAGLAGFSQKSLLAFGLLSLAVAAVFIVNQRDYKRMLAYSSVEHMGILAFGVGVGGAGVFAALLQALNHSLTKGMLFLTAGNLLAAYKTKAAGEVRGILDTVPVSGVLWLAGFLAISGTPPFGLFISEFTILQTAFGTGHTLAGVLYLLFLTVVFIGMASIFLPMAAGKRDRLSAGVVQPEPWQLILPPAILAAATLFLGVYLPPGLKDFLWQAAQAIGDAP